MACDERQAGFSVPEHEIYVDGERGVWAPDGLPGALIVLVGKIVQDECDGVGYYTAHGIARRILETIRSHDVSWLGRSSTPPTQAG